MKENLPIIAYFGMSSREVLKRTKIHFLENTITELAFIPEKIKDGKYILNLQIAAFVSDASPSRPILFEIL